MFTGIVEEAGTVESTERRGDVLVARIRASSTLQGLAKGGSIAVDGCCLTAVEVSASTFSCELTEETLRRTDFEHRLRPGRLVNLERPMRADGRFDGHIVQGHVDGVGRILRIESSGDSAQMWVEPPEQLERYLVEKGSVALDGISLTIAALRPRAIMIALIPHTIEVTNLREARPGDPVNVEVDVLAKYVERLLQPRAS